MRLLAEPPLVEAETDQSEGWQTPVAGTPEVVPTISIQSRSGAAWVASAVT